MKCTMKLTKYTLNVGLFFLLAIIVTKEYFIYRFFLWLSKKLVKRGRIRM